MIMVFFLAACATPALKVVDSTGRKLPYPNYTLQSLSNNLVAVFYYASLTYRKDKDGSMISHPTYLPMNKIHIASSSSDLLLVIEISNPERVEYSLWSESIITYKKKSRGRYNRTFTGSSLAKSIEDYRQFIFKMPINDKIKEVSYSVKLYDGSKIAIMNFGDFHYKIKKGG